MSKEPNNATALTTAAVQAEPSEVERVAEVIAPVMLNEFGELRKRFERPASFFASCRRIACAALAATPSQPAEPSEGVERLRLLQEAYDDLRRYIYDKTPARREYSIGRFKERLAAPNQPAESEDRHD